MDLFAGDGVAESQELGVQEIPSIAWETGEILKRLAGYAVQRIAGQRMADGCQVNPDLMRAPGVQAALERGRAGCAGEHLCQ